MLDEYDWRLSEDRYWEEHGSYASQVWRYNEIAKRERRSEMNLPNRAFDWLLEALFPKWYFWATYCHTQLPWMRLFYKDGSPSNLLVRHPLPQLVEGKESPAVK